MKYEYIYILEYFVTNDNSDNCKSLEPKLAIKRNKYQETKKGSRLGWAPEEFCTSPQPGSSEIPDCQRLPALTHTLKKFSEFKTGMS